MSEHKPILEHVKKQTTRKMSWLWLVSALVVLAVFLVLSLQWFEPATHTAQPEMRQILTLHDDKAVRLRVSCDGMHLYDLSQTEDRVTVTENPAYALDQEKTRPLFHYVCSMIASRSFEAEELTQFGLGRMKAEVWYEDGSVDTILFGNTVSGDWVYLTKNDSTTVWLVHDMYRKALEQPLASLHTCQFPVELDDPLLLHSIVIERPGQPTLELGYQEKKVGSLVKLSLIQPDSYEADVEKGTAMLAAAATLRPVAYAGLLAEWPEAGLEKGMTLRLNISGGEAMKLRFGAEQAGRRLVQCNDGDELYWVEETALTALENASFESLATPFCCLIEFNTLDALSFAKGDELITFEIHDGHVFCGEKKVDEQIFKRLYQQLAGLQISGTYQGENFESTCYQIIFHFAQPGQASTVVTFQALDERRAVVIRNDRSYFTVQMQELQEIWTAINELCEKK